MISLSDNQLRIVMDMAKAIDPDRRDIFLQRCGAMLRMRERFGDGDVVAVTQLALAGLIHEPTAA